MSPESDGGTGSGDMPDPVRLAPASQGDAAKDRETSWELMAQRNLPSWYDEAKLGIIVHWGPYSVPAWAPASGEMPQPKA